VYAVRPGQLLLLVLVVVVVLFAFSPSVCARISDGKID